MTASVSDALLDNALRGLAGQAAFERGVEVERQESVGDVRETDGGVRARVTGSAGIGSYAVGLHLRDGRVHGECTCPVGAQRVFCKHMVAVARR